MSSLVPGMPIDAENVRMLTGRSVLRSDTPAMKTKRGLRLPRSTTAYVERVTATHIKFKDGGGWLLTNGFDGWTYLGEHDQ